MLPRIYTRSRPRAVRRTLASFTILLLIATGCTRIQAVTVWTAALHPDRPTLTEPEAAHFLAWANTAKQQEKDRMLARWLTHVAEARDARLLGEYLEAIERAERARTIDLPPPLPAIIACESNWVPTARNPSSSASGLGQMLRSTWAYTKSSYAATWVAFGWGHHLAEANRHAEMATAPVETQKAAIRVLYEREGTSPWAASSGCW